MSAKSERRLAAHIEKNATSVHNAVLAMVYYGATLEEIQSAVQSAFDDPYGSYSGPEVSVKITEKGEKPETLSIMRQAMRNLDEEDRA